MTDNAQTELWQAVLTAREALDNAEKALEEAIDLKKAASADLNDARRALRHAQILVGKGYDVLRAAELALRENAP